MPEDGEVAQWDFLTLVTWWNLYLLPALLVLVVVTVVIHRRLRPASIAGSSGVRTIQRIGLIHLLVGLRAVIYLAQELQARRTMGIFQTNPVSILITALEVLINPLLGLGLWHLRPGARRLAIVWYVLWSILAAGVTYWTWYYHAVVDLADWPDHVIGKVLPLILLIVVLLPQTRRVFASPSKPRPDADSIASERPAAEGTRLTPRDWPIVARVVILLLILACSTLVVDAADWIYRAVNEAESGLPPG